MVHYFQSVPQRKVEIFHALKHNHTADYVIFLTSVLLITWSNRLVIWSLCHQIISFDKWRCSVFGQKTIKRMYKSAAGAKSFSSKQQQTKKPRGDLKRRFALAYLPPKKELSCSWRELQKRWSWFESRSQRTDDKRDLPIPRAICTGLASTRAAGLMREVNCIQEQQGEKNHRESIQRQLQRALD